MTFWQAAALLLWLVLLLRFFPSEVITKLKTDTSYLHLWFSSIVVIALLWTVQAGIEPSLELHLLGITTLVLCHGWRIAWLIGSIAVVFLVAAGKVNVADTGSMALLTVVLPALFSYLIFALSYHYLPRHLFIYIFVAGFANAALTIIFKMSLTAFWLYYQGTYSWNSVYQNYLQLALLIWFAEALLNGMAVTLMSVYRPHWLRTFYDNEYLSPDR
ncbi:energy-coupling factor ABC transporter permease [Arsukibacterium indicum]|uniref:Energy-coupling factor ABC transporter permease n=1 Tax=Arsukibacterium indicum TaxID=2848612 RepID=A0ABS6MGS7_9GAMM|nr:energy-coupling factor ABC transporter permease [Arsukibacterium indicum]MBV2128023.1 energy-coupling factor ABC transporter permease [Arsukibacterium indicum]